MTSPSLPRPGAGWILDELASAGRENLDESHVRRYDGKEDADAPGEIALLRDVGLDADARLIEFGSGTGQLTVAAASACAEVIAVDVSPAMLSALETKITALDLSNVTVVNGGFLTYEHAGDPVQFVYSRFALHHLPDFWKAVALRRIRGLMAPGGVLRLWDVVYSFDLADTETALEAWCASGGDEIDGEWSREELEEHVRDEHSTFTWLLESMIERSGFSIENASYTEDKIFAKYVARAV